MVKIAQIYWLNYIGLTIQDYAADYFLPSKLPDQM